MENSKKEKTHKIVGVCCFCADIIMIVGIVVIDKINLVNYGVAYSKKASIGNNPFFIFIGVVLFIISIVCLIIDTYYTYKTIFSESDNY